MAKVDHGTNDSTRRTSLLMDRTTELQMIEVMARRRIFQMSKLFRVLVNADYQQLTDGGNNDRKD